MQKHSKQFFNWLLDNTSTDVHVLIVPTRKKKREQNKTKCANGHNFLNCSSIPTTTPSEREKAHFQRNPLSLFFLFHWRYFWKENISVAASNDLCNFFTLFKICLQPSKKWWLPFENIKALYFFCHHLFFLLFNMYLV